MTVTDHNKTESIYVYLELKIFSITYIYYDLKKYFFYIRLKKSETRGDGIKCDSRILC